MNFSKIAKDLRSESGLSQMELSKKLGITAAAIGHLELGKREPGSPTLIAYSKYFDVSTDYLLGLEDDFGVRTAAPIGDASRYSSEERNLIDEYRSLNPACQKLVKDTIKTLRSSTPQSGHNKNKIS